MGRRAWFTDVFASAVFPPDDIFSFVVFGNEMDADEGYRSGDVVLINTCVMAMPGHDVLARLPSGAVVFRRLQEGPQGRYLLALNTKQVIQACPHTEIYGVAFQSGRSR